MYNFDWIVLKRTIIKESNIYLTIFSKEYWKITAWNKDSKSRTQVDIWNVYNFTSSNEKLINKIENLKAKVIIDTCNLNYTQVENILNLCNNLEKLLPFSSVFESLFEDYIYSLPEMQNPEKNSIITVFFNLKLFKKLWIAKNPDKSWNMNLYKVFSIIDIYSLAQIMSIKWINTKDIRAINEYNNSTLLNYIN